MIHSCIRRANLLSLLGLLCGITLGCRVESLDPEVEAQPAPVRVADDGAGDVRMIVVGLMPDEAALLRATATLCRAARAGTDPQTATYAALRELECAERSRGLTFTEALLMPGAARWGAATEVPAAYLASDAALSALQRGGLDRRIYPPMARAECPVAAPVAWALEDLADAAQLAAQLALDETAAVGSGTDGVAPDHVSDEDAGVGDLLARRAVHSDSEPDAPTRDGDFSAAFHGPAAAADLATQSAQPDASPTDDRSARGTRVLYGLLWRDADGALHGALLSTGDPAAGASRLPPGLDVLPGQNLLLGERSGILLDAPYPRDPASFPAPAASALASHDSAGALRSHEFAHLLGSFDFPQAPDSREVADGLGAHDAAALQWPRFWLPREGPPRGHAIGPTTAFAALECPAQGATESAP